MERRRESWRWWFAAAGVLFFVGGPQHPRGTMVQMLGDPAWVPAHVLFFLGLAALLAGLRACAREAAPPARVRRWLRWATVGTALELLEMAFHTAAVVDRASLAAGRATPVLSTHLALAVVCYPVFGVTVAGLVIAAARARTLGSPWVAPLGVVGSLAYGAAAPLAVLAPWSGVGLLFPMFLLFALWLLFAAAWAAPGVRLPVALEGR
jgi:hypothetical protein